MSDIASKIAKLKELVEVKNATEDHQEPVTAALPTDPAPNMRNKKKPRKRAKLQPMGRPYLENDPEPRPKSLEGISKLDLFLLYQDGQMSEKEKEWFQKRTIPDRNTNPDGLYWMRF